ncbi:hypothetical protein OEZ85_008999 [Tetradesmus obliquus]|uniref:Uncharacterized protein n=1 Tax=Tetradesmus obliquus TaxID=3088 RepID=A0ABY8TKH3_TETOB|nr:hypothetical protein OEZ85_008999 [Tetradesmus obliquus]
MPPKARKGKKKAPEIVEPEHDPTWDRVVISGLWDRPITALPDANTWPSWGALRERVLSACREIRVVNAPSVRDAFAAEVVKLSPPLLKAVDFRGCHNLHKLVLSPQSSCPSLETLNLSSCPGLEYLLLQSNSVRQVDLSNCGALTKVLLQCPKLQSLAITGCSQLESLMLWSDEITELDLTGADKVTKLELQCPQLNAEASKLPQVPVPPTAVRPVHPPIAVMLRENAREAALAAAEARERQWKAATASSGRYPAVYRSLTGMS